MSSSKVIEQPITESSVPPTIAPLILVVVSALVARGAEAVSLEAWLADAASLPAPVLGGAVLVATQLLFIHAAGVTIRARKEFSVPYPHFYPAKADGFKHAVAFQTAVRAQHNILEHVPLMLAKAAYAASVVGVPYTAAAAVAVFVLARLAYIRAYTSGTVVNRMPFFITALLADMLNMGAIVLFVVRAVKPGLV
mmetsp:Transcript_13457/g.42399  ORF Transcript_13457/g.42399 Transcript_13457/m.42399 type:complete len:195 (-) Transcript_13457:67-651(-)